MRSTEGKSMLDLASVMHRLSESRPIFHSEADFQHALAWQLHTEPQDARIRLEYRPFPNERVYIDIWCELNGLSTAIELKYPTRRTSITSEVNERFELSNHGAQDVTRYDIVKDIVRIERTIDAIPNSAAAAIVLTNDSSFWNASPRLAPTIDEAFRIHEGRILAGSCGWATNAGLGTTKGRTAILNVRGTYAMAWQHYSSLNEQWGQFRFVIIEPKPATSIAPWPISPG
jgi:hypothetical protein